jgi:hypothetical protein
MLKGDILEMLEKFYFIHFLMSALLVLVFAVNMFLAHKAFSLYQIAYQSDYWPRIKATVVDAILQRVVLRHNNSTSIQQHYEVIYNTQYQVNGRAYRKHLTKTTLSKEQAETMKADNTIELTYNPDKPEEAFWQIPEKHPLLLMTFGILVFNVLGVILAKSISQFLA